ncbi:STAS domain-containing protein [Anaerosacchariphilus polymeriproducens]|uniref:Anti-sigma factor antagonist n=1 Tax=Anaerosacchariphilus polymeriproducens TaxID=1812858 RepID=A0A371ARQ7_9FIRM|nr:anti-sigma factor antagonist [Anaerosacchariphilus polymeriproducens]RDU22261.1 STAS domain-containing protein [Anaerosacchariphilus polymeriproducens]
MYNNFDVIGTWLVIRVPKELDHHNAEMIRKEADRYIERENIQSIIFDFQDTVFMDSSGIGTIMGRYKKVKFSGGNVIAVHTNDRVKRIFLLSGLNKIITTYDEMPKQI